MDQPGDLDDVTRINVHEHIGRLQQRLWRPALGGAASVTITVLPGQLTGALGPSMKDDLGFGDTALGALFTAMFVVSAFGAWRVKAS